MSILILAVQVGRLAVVKQLVGQGEDVNATNRHGTTALYWAVESDYLEMVKYLLARGADSRPSRLCGIHVKVKIKKVKPVRGTVRTSRRRPIVGLLLWLGCL